MILVDNHVPDVARDIARGPISTERLEITTDGKVKLRVKTRWADGSTHLAKTLV